jgi:RNA polymerase sigma factor (sigma-70 family)
MRSSRKYCVHSATARLVSFVSEWETYMLSIYYFIPSERQAEIVDELRRHDQYFNTLRSFIEHCYRNYEPGGWYQALKLVHNLLRLIDPVQPDELRVAAAGRLLARVGAAIPPWRWAMLAPSIEDQAELHQRLLEDEIEQRSLAVLFNLLHEQSSMLQVPPEDFYTALRKEVAAQVTTDEVGQGWSRRLKRHREVTMDPLALQEIKADISLENLPALDDLFSTLSDRKRELMTLYYIDSLSVREIADRCQLSTNAVTSHLAQARKILRQQYS